MDKCNLLVNDIEVLGHIIRGNWITPAKEKITHITDFPTPTSKKQLQQFLGSVNYIGSHLPHIATLQAPLTELTSVDHSSTNRGCLHGLHRTTMVQFVSWRTANCLATTRFGFLANHTTNHAVPRHGFSNCHGLPWFATVCLFTRPYFSRQNFVKYF